jgi:hypothetical protein
MEDADIRFQMARHALSLRREPQCLHQEARPFLQAASCVSEHRLSTAKEGKNMATDLTVILEDRPGTVAAMGETLGKAGINIAGCCGIPCEGQGVFHILVDDASAAHRVLQEAGVEVRDERQVLVLQGEDRPGWLGEVTRRIARAGVNLELVYTAMNNQVIIGVDDLSKARAAV